VSDPTFREIVDFLDEALFVRDADTGESVVFMSGYADDAIVQHGVSRGEHRFVQKPFTPVALLREVRAALRPSAAERLER